MWLRVRTAAMVFLKWSEIALTPHEDERVPDCGLLRSASCQRLAASGTSHEFPFFLSLSDQSFIASAPHCSRFSSSSGSLVASSMVHGGWRRRGVTFSSVTQQARSGCVFEPYIMQECADPGIDPLLLLIARQGYQLTRLITPALRRQSAFMAIRAADAASVIGKMASMSNGRCVVE
jgi:hypothetical protein